MRNSSWIPEVERAFTVNDGEQIVRARLLNRMKKLGFKVISENDELKFRRGSPFADEPGYRMYITVRSNPAQRNHLIAVLRAPLLKELFDLRGLTGVNAYYDSVLPLVEQIALGEDATSTQSFLDLSKRVARNMALFWIVISGFFILLLAGLFEWPQVVHPVIWWWVDFFSALIVLAMFLSRMGMDVYGYSQIKAIESAI